MFKYLLILGLGVALGYGYGWRDAHKYEMHIAERLLDGIGGQSRKLVASDVDSQMRASEKR
jgi:hypothetical protein